MAQVDSSIYLQQQAPDIMGNIQKGVSLAQMLFNQKLQAKQLADQQAMKEAYKSGMVQGPDGQVSFDQNKTLSGLANVDAQAAYQAKSQFDQLALDRQEQAMTQREKQIDLSARILSGVKDQDSWTKALQVGSQFGMDMSKMPASYDPQLVDRYKNAAFSAKERLEQQQNQISNSFKEKELELKRQENAAKNNEQNVSNASKLRTERSSLATTKATQQVSAAYNKVQEAAKNPSAAGDLSLIFNYMKMLDPGSVVREGEFATAQNATGIPEQVRNSYNKALNGQRLGVDQRKDFINQSGGVYKGQLDIQKNIDKQYESLAKKRGIDPKDVILNFEANQPSNSQAHPQDPQAVEWAKQNPNDPRARQIMQLNQGTL